MKKRILILVLALACLFTLASCKKDTAYSLYSEANTVLEEANGLEAKVTIDMKMVMADETMEETITMDMKVNGSNILATTSMEMDGETMDNTILYVDGIMYMDMGELGGKMKMEVSAEDFADEYGMGDVSLPEFTEEALKEIKLEKDGDNTKFTVSMDKETALEYVGEGMLGSLIGEEDGITVDKFDVTFVFDKDSKLAKMEIDMKLISPDADEGALEATMVYEFKNLGTAPTVEAPADADDYLDMSDMMG